MNIRDKLTFQNIFIVLNTILIKVIIILASVLLPIYSIRFANRLDNIESKINNIKMSDNSNPYKLMIYYGYPSQVNNVNSVNAAAEIFSEYDNIVFGANLENNSHPDHTNLTEIIKKIKNIKPNIILCGYLDIGVTTNNFSIEYMKNSIDNWKITGVNTIFLDDFGYDFGTTRERQNEIVKYVHDSNLACFANAWNFDDIFSSNKVSIYNENGLKTNINNNDYFLLESFPYNLTQWKPLDQLLLTIDKARLYRDEFGTKICAVSPIKYSDIDAQTSQKLRLIIQAIAFVFSIDFIGDSDDNYSATTKYIDKISYWDTQFPTIPNKNADYFVNGKNITRYDYQTTISYDTIVGFTSPTSSASL